MYGSSLLFIFFLAVTIPEYFGEFGVGGRTFLFWTFTAAAAYISVRFFMIPIFKLLRLGQLISHDQAALIIGKHFLDVKDKLLNTLQLKEVANHGGGSLVDAAITQRIEELRPIPFTSAVDFGENRKYIKYVAPPLAVILVILFAAPSVFTESTERLVRHAEEIERIAPYSIAILNDDLSVPENDDFLLEVDLDGDVVPNKLYLVLAGQQFKEYPTGSPFLRRWLLFSRVHIGNPSCSASTQLFVVAGLPRLHKVERRANP